MTTYSLTLSTLELATLRRALDECASSKAVVGTVFEESAKTLEKRLADLHWRKAA